MKLRKLRVKDSSFMLEWMHDEDVTKELNTSFGDKTIEDCLQFIKNARNDKNNIHFAIVNNLNEYMGTVSLKHLDSKNKRAEFAIVVRKKAMGHGYSWFGMYEILRYGFEKMKLDSIYWCVSKTNKRACNFYEKHGFAEYVDIDESVLFSYKGVDNLKWFVVKSRDRSFVGSSMIKIINIKTLGTERFGKLSFAESKRDVPFDIKRIYYITMVDEGIKRGFHAHKNLKQLIFCPYGTIFILLDDGTKKEEIMLDNPSIGILLEKPLWREMVWIESNSVLCVLASDYYDENDYIRDYQQFLNYTFMRSKK